MAEPGFLYIFRISFMFQTRYVQAVVCSTGSTIYRTKLRIDMAIQITIAITINI